MKAITIRQPWASLIAAQVKTIETRSRRTSYRGRVAIHAGQRCAQFGEAYDAWSAAAQLVDAPTDQLYHACRGRDGATEWADPLPSGAVVASAVLTDCAPIGGPQSFRTGTFEGDEGDYPGQPVVVFDDWAPADSKYRLVIDRPGGGVQDITDQLPYGDFTPGRWALLLDDIKPTTERCPWCWGDVSKPFCRVCYGARTCDPIPAKGQQAVPWTWTP